MAQPHDDAPASPASRRPQGGEEHDSIREDRQRDDHADTHHGPHQEPEDVPQAAEWELSQQPVEHGRQPSRPGQPGRWEARPGDRDQPGSERSPEDRPQGQHEKA